MLARVIGMTGEVCACGRAAEVSVKTATMQSRAINLAFRVLRILGELLEFRGCEVDVQGDSWRDGVIKG